MNTVKSILSELKAKDRYSYYKQVEVLIDEPNLVKLRIYIREGLFIQVYRNDESKTTSFALVSGKERIFGRDEEDRIWHRHPLGNPNYHDSSKTGKKPINLRRFLKEVDGVLRDLKLV